MWPLPANRVSTRGDLMKKLFALMVNLAALATLLYTVGAPFEHGG